MTRNQCIIEYGQTAFEFLRVPNVEHVVDVLALVPVDHIDHARRNVAGGQCVVQSVRRFHPSAFTRLLINAVGHIGGNDRGFAAHEGPVQIGIVHAANRQSTDVGGLRVALVGGFHRQGIDRRLNDVHFLGALKSLAAAGPNHTIFLTLTAGFLPAIERRIEVTKIHSGHTVEMAHDERHRRTAMTALTGGDFGRGVVVKAHGFVLDRFAHHRFGNAAPRQVRHRRLGVFAANTGQRFGQRFFPLIFVLGFGHRYAEPLTDLFRRIDDLEGFTGINHQINARAGLTGGVIFELACVVE